MSHAIFFAYVYVPTVVVIYLAFTQSYVPSDSLARYRLIILVFFAPILLKYALHLFIAPWFPLGEQIRLHRHGPKVLPSVSVLIAAWNEEVGISATIDSVVSTHYPHLEIVVVNDGSTDRTDEIVRDFIARYRAKHGENGVSFKYCEVENGGKARALNVALALAHGEIVVTIDADSVMDSRALKNFVKHYGSAAVASVAGNVSIGNRAMPLGIIQQLEYLYGFYFKRADSLLNAVYIVGGAAASYRRDVITKLGGFDEGMITEDIEISTRLQDHGYKVRYAPDAIVYTEGPSDFTGLFLQRLRWKYGRLLTFIKYKHLFFSTKRPHNPYLTFVVLPFALFAEALLFFEGVLLTIFFLYTFTTHDFIPLVVMIVALTIIVCLQIVSDPQAKYHKNLIFYAPGAWIIFYVIDFVEFQALMRSIWRLATRQGFSWQRWKRVGVFDE